MNNPLYATAGVGAGFGLTALIEWAKSPSTISAIAFLGSALSTALGWWLARRAEIRRANLELEREQRAMDREQRYLDALIAKKIAAAETATAD